MQATDKQDQEIIDALHPKAQGRPWTQADVDRLMPEERAALELLELDDEREQQLARYWLRKGKALLLLEDRGTYQKLGCASMDELCQHLHGVRARAGRRYRAVARQFTVSQVGQAKLALGALTVVMEFPAEFHDLLFQLASGFTERELREVLERCPVDQMGQRLVLELDRIREERQTPKDALELYYEQALKAMEEAERRAWRFKEELREGGKLTPEQAERLRLSLKKMGVTSGSLEPLLAPPLAGSGADNEPPPAPPPPAPPPPAPPPEPPPPPPPASSPPPPPEPPPVGGGGTEPEAGPQPNRRSYDRPAPSPSTAGAPGTPTERSSREERAADPPSPPPHTTGQADFPHPAVQVTYLTVDLAEPVC